MSQPVRRSRSLAAIVAHPDDDAYGVAGLVALHKDDPGFRFVLVHATDGEGGAIAEGSGATRDNLGAVRREEDRRAWAVLGHPPDRHEWFGYPDGALTEVPRHELVDRIAAVLDQERPEVVVTFGPDGITGHPDHVAISQATTEAFLQLADDGGPGLRRLSYGGIRQSVIDRWNGRRVRAGLAAWDPNVVYHLRGVPDESIDIDVDTAEVAPLVRRAMQEHRTQWNDMNNPEATEEQRRKGVSRETQVIAWPPTRPGRLLTDIFDGL